MKLLTDGLAVMYMPRPPLEGTMSVSFRQTVRSPQAGTYRNFESTPQTNQHCDHFSLMYYIFYFSLLYLKVFYIFYGLM